MSQRQSHRSGSQAAKSRTYSQLRIIGGQWRGRKLRFVPASGLRPTTDRVRETLFNWLAPRIHGARCLDLFCGSGALGLEALSRGGAHCDFVDSHNANVQQVQTHLNTLQADAVGHCHTMTAGDFLASTRQSWDIVFIDPPFGQALIEPASTLLQIQRLRPDALIYIERGIHEPEPLLPASWQLHRDKRAGEVSYRLYRYNQLLPVSP
ncbi:MAG: 16S rRNA (guanine(966)-N(2))-methyltransferase RsmD [Parahaliea sp.]